VPDGPNCRREDGRYRRIEAGTERFTDPEWREVISPDGVRFLSAPSACFVTRFRAAAVTEQIRPPIPEDLSIPAFLRR
jgi:hypothetical protein